MWPPDTRSKVIQSPCLLLYTEQDSRWFLMSLCSLQPERSFHLISLALLLGMCPSSQPTKSLTYRAEEDAHNCLSAGIDSASLNLQRLENSIGMCLNLSIQRPRHKKRDLRYYSPWRDMLNHWIYLKNTQWGKMQGLDFIHLELTGLWTLISRLHEKWLKRLKNKRAMWCQLKRKIIT